MNILYYTILVLNVAIPVYTAISMGYGDKQSKVSYQMQILIQIVSCAFYFDACRRICWEVKKDKDLNVNYVPMFIHLSTYILYLMSLLYTYWSFVRNVAEITQKQFGRVFIIKDSIASLSEVLLCYVFYSIHTMCMSLTTETTDESIEILSSSKSINTDDSKTDKTEINEAFLTILVTEN